MTTRAKVYVESVKLMGGIDQQEEVQMRAVTSGTKEDNTYSKFTPSADFRMLVTNENLFGQFKPGQKRYIDISEPVD